MPVAGLLEEAVEIPDGVQLRVDGDFVVVTGGGHTLRRRLFHRRLRIDVKGQQVTVRCEFPRRKEAALVGTFAAHLRNMVVGVREGFTYEMKIVDSHFPLKATANGSEFLIENFLGEKFPRKTRIIWASKVGVKGDHWLLTGPGVEAVGQTTPNIQQATRLAAFSPRMCQY